jgi:holo-[acyl-carrier protein] synthase
VIDPPEALAGQAGVVGVGIDVVAVDRMRQALERTPGFAVRYFSDHERATCARRADPAASYAARFAAKEAALKALGLGIFDVPIREIELVSGEGAPELRLSGSAARRAAAARAGRWLVSVSHDGGVAAAVVVALVA